MGEEILDELDVVRCQSHEIPGATAHQISRRQCIELAVDIDAHLRQQPERHIVSDPGFEPVQHTRERRQDGERPEPARIGCAVLEREHRQGAHYADADEGDDTQHAQHKGRGEPALPGHDQSAEALVR